MIERKPRTGLFEICAGFDHADMTISDPFGSSTGRCPMKRKNHSIHACFRSRHNV
jgi:hypothetical protein